MTIDHHAGRAWMVYSTSSASFPVCAITYNHRSEAMYRAIQRDPENVYVKRSLASGLENVRMLSSETPAEVRRLLCNMHSTYQDGTGETWSLARHGSHCWTKLKNLWKSGTRRTMDHTQFAVRSLPGTICVQNKTGHWLGRVFELLPYHIHLEQYACQVQHQESSSRVVQSSSELYRFPNFEQERWVWGLLGNFTCIGRVRYYLRCGIL